MEIWKDIEGYEGLYQISSLGNIKSLYNYRKGNMLKPKLKRGYYQIGLRKNNVRKWYAVHRLVAKTFIPNPNNLPQINHKDENKLNNNVDNLEWCDAKYNNSYGTRLERVSKTNKLSKKVIQYDLNWNKIATFNSLAEASRKTNTNLSSLSCCINKKRNKANNCFWVCEGEVMPNA